MSGNYSAPPSKKILDMVFCDFLKNRVRIEGLPDLAIFGHPVVAPDTFRITLISGHMVSPHLRSWID